MRVFFVVLVAVIFTRGAIASDCVGATYWNDALLVCSSCPPGYDYNTDDGKTDISQCQIKCTGGKYVATPRLVSDGIAYIDTGVVSTGKTYIEITFQFSERPIMNNNNQVYAVWGAIPYNYQNNTGALTPRISLGVWLNQFFTGVNATKVLGEFDTDVHTFKLNAKTGDGYFDDKKFHISPYPNMEMPMSSYLFARQTLSGVDTVAAGLTIYSYREWDEYDGVLLRDMVPHADDDGTVCMWDNVSGRCFYSPVGAFGNLYGCHPVGEGYWAPESITNYGQVGTRNACVDGLTTIGYGVAADEAADCGRILSVGGHKLYLRSQQKTSRALKVQYGNEIFYGNATTEQIGHIHIRTHDGTNWSIYDDSVDDE